MARLMRAISTKDNYTEKEFGKPPKETYIKATFFMIRNMVMEFIDGKTA